MRRPSPFEINKFANERFAADRERRLLKHEQKLKQGLSEVGIRGNAGGYEPTLIQGKLENLRLEILAFADALAQSADTYGVPLHAGAESVLAQAATEMVAGTLTSIRGELDLHARRTRTFISNSGGTHEIGATLKLALREGNLKLSTQRIVASRSLTNVPARDSQGEVTPLKDSTMGGQRPEHSARFGGSIRSDPGALSPGQEFPRHMYHPTEKPRMVVKESEEMALGSDWSREYIYQRYPHVKHHWDGRIVTVENANEEAALGGGWADTKAAFELYRGPRPSRTDEHDPAKWVAEWGVAGLLPEHRIRIKAILLRADAAFSDSSDPDAAVAETMKQTFDKIARVLFDAEILSEQLLKSDLGQPFGIVRSRVVGGGTLQNFPKIFFQNDSGDIGSGVTIPGIGSLCSGPKWQSGSLYYWKLQVPLRAETVCLNQQIFNSLSRQQPKVP